MDARESATEELDGGWAISDEPGAQGSATLSWIFSNHG